MSNFLLSVGTYAGSEHAPTVSEFIHALVLLCLETLVSLAPSNFSGSHTLSASSSTEIPRPEWRNLVKTFHLGLCIPLSPILHFVQSVGLCISSHLLQEKASPVIIEQGTDL